MSEAELALRILPPPGASEGPAAADERPKAADQQLPMPSSLPPDGAEQLPPARPVSSAADAASSADSRSRGLTDRDVPVWDRMSTRPLNLEDAVALAFQYQPRLRIYREDIAEARGRGEVAFAPFLPRVWTSSQLTAARGPLGPRGAEPVATFGPGDKDFFLAELNMQWTLIDFGRRAGRYAQAQLGIDIARLQLTRASQTVAYQVAQAYYRVLSARAARTIEEEAVRRAESILGISRSSLKAGLIERDQVLRAEVQLAQTRRRVVAAVREERVAVAALNLAIGLNVSSPTEIVDRTDEPPFPLSLDECLQRAVDNRLEIQVALQSIAVALQGVRVTQADFAPRVYVTSSIAYDDGNGVLSGTTKAASLYLDWSLFEGGRRVGEVRVASAVFRAASAQAELVCDTIAFEVNEAYRDLEAACRTIELSRPAVTQARENLRLVTQKYRAGDATPTDIVDAETSLTRAQQDYYDAQYDYLASLARLEYAMGVAPAAGAEEGK